VIESGAIFHERIKSRPTYRVVYVGVRKMTRKSNLKKKLGATVRLRVHSGEIVEGQVVYLWEEKGVQLVRVASGDLVYNVPASMLVDETKAK
jgi:hypothetical protein